MRSGTVYLRTTSHSERERVALSMARFEQVSTRLQSLGHNVEEVFITKPSVKGATLKSTGKART